MKQEEIELVKLGIKKLMDKSTPIQLLDFGVDVEADKRSIQASNDYWEAKDESEPFKYVFRDVYSFNHQGTGFKLYVNGQIQLIKDDEHGVEASEPEIKVIEVEKNGQDTVTISDKRMDDELKNLINQYSYSRNILIMEQKNSQESSSPVDESNDFAEFNKETVEELLRYISEHKSDEFIAAYVSEKLDTAHLYGYNEGKGNK